MCDVTRALRADDYPRLFDEACWGALRCRFELSDALPPPNVTGNVSVVPFDRADVLLLRLASGAWDVPGGTLEPGEDVLDTLRRELLEEAGARLIAFQPFGFWRCHSSAATPYRPHLPHPDSCRVVGYGEVAVIGEPLNPADAEQVIEVASVPLEEACRRFLSVGRGDLADLYRLAARIKGLAKSAVGGGPTPEAVTMNRSRVGRRRDVC